MLIENILWIEIIGSIIIFKSIKSYIAINVSFLLQKKDI